MIRYRDKVLEDYFIDPVTAEITDKDGNVQKTHLYRGRPMLKCMPVHCIQAHTSFGFKPGYDVHHIDENPLNNALSNLQYLTHSEHNHVHKVNNQYTLGKHLTEEHKKKLSEANKGKTSAMKGKHMPEGAKKKISEARKGKKMSEDAKKKMSEAHKGRHRSEEIRKRISESLKEMRWYNNGVENCYTKECPGEGWIRGMLAVNNHAKES